MRQMPHRNLLTVQHSKLSL